MSLWLVKATWRGDDAETSEKWEVNAETVQDAVKVVAAHIRFHPHHVEARRYEPEGTERNITAALSPGEARRVTQ